MSPGKISSRFIITVIVIGFVTVSAPGQARLKVLISNDDGVDSPGIEALCKAFSGIADVTVAAPSQNRGGVGHGMNFDGPIMVRRFEKHGAPWFAIDALPASCVRLGLVALVREKPDLVVSGINRGENIGTVTFYSGTVACAREAALMGIPSIAISLESGPEMNYPAAADFVLKLAREVVARALLKKGEFLNVNYPALPQERIKGISIARQDMRPDPASYEKRTSPAGQLYYWPIFSGLGPGDKRADHWALKNGYISITPMGIDQTHDRRLLDHEVLKKLQIGR